MLFDIIRRTKRINFRIEFPLWKTIEGYLNIFTDQKDKLSQMEKYSSDSLIIKILRLRKKETLFVVWLAI